MTQQLDELYEEIEHSITRARSEAESGEMVYLTGVEESIRTLCELVAGLPKAEAEPYGQKLDGLAVQLTEIRDLLEARQGNIRHEIDELNLRHKAARAYRTSKGKTGKPDSSGENG